VDQSQYKQLFSTIAQMEQYLKRIANQPTTSDTTPLGQASPGRSSRGGAQQQKSSIYPDSNRIIREQATGSQRSKPASSPGAGRVTAGAVNILLDSSKLNPAKMYLASKAMNPFALSLRNFIDTISDLDKNKAENIERVAGIGNILRGITGLDKLSPAKASSNLKMLGGGIRDFVQKITDVDKRRADKVKPLSYIGGLFSGLSNVLNISPGQIISAKVFLPMLANTVKYFADTISKINAKKANEAMAVIPKMGLGLLAFTGSIALAALAVTAVALDPVKFLLLFTIMGATALAFNTIGQYDKNINKGSLAVAGMGLGTLAFSGALMLSANLLPSLENMIKIPLTIAAMAGVFGLAGMFWDKIALGALAMGAVGLATWLISKPIETLAGVLEKNPNAMWQIPLMLTGLGTVFALAGAGPVPLMIGAGALALGVAGGALWVLSKGLSTMLTMPTVTKEKAEGIELALRAVVTGFGKSFQDLSLKESLTLPLKIPMVGLMGLTLLGLATGISSYQAKAGNFGPKDSENLQNTISGLSRAFATAGSSEGMSQLFGFNVGSNDVERGIASTMRMGSNLKNLADGVLAWKKMPLTPADVQMISDNVGRVLNVIPGIFAGIGKADQGSTGTINYLGLSFENPFGKTDTERGIASTMKMGQNLKQLADGVMAWKDGGKNGFSSAQIPGIQKNISLILGTIPQSFAALGSADRETEGIFPWSDGDITKGVELAEQLGPSLNGISELLNSVKTGNMAKATKEITTNMPVLLSGYANSLNSFSKTLGGDPEDAIDSLEDFLDLADPMEKMAKSITSMTTAMKGQFDLAKQSPSQLDAFSKYFLAVSDVSKANGVTLKQNMDAVVKSGFGTSDMNAALSAQQVSVTNQQITQPPRKTSQATKPTNAPASQSDINQQILAALNSIAQLLAATNANSSQQVKAIEELNHLISGGIKVKDSGGLG